MSISQGFAFRTNNTSPCHDVGAGGQPKRESLVQLLVFSIVSTYISGASPSPTNNSADLGLVGCYYHSTAVRDDRGKIHSCLSLATMSDVQLHLLYTCGAEVVMGSWKTATLTHAPCVGLFVLGHRNG